MYWAMSTTWHGWVPESPAEVQESLQAAVGIGTLRGKVRDDRFEVQAPLGGRNSWRPVLTGRLSDAGGGTFVRLAVTVHPFVLVFTLLHAIPFMGLSWLIGCWAFSREVEPAITRLIELIGVTEVGDQARDRTRDVAEPDEPGAAARAPLSLEARTDIDSARFVLEGPRAWYGSPTRSLVFVEQGQLRVRRPQDDLLVEWHQLRGVSRSADTLGPMLLLHTDDGDEVVHAAQLDEDDLDWLVHYLDHRRQAWAPSEQDADRFEAATQRMVGQRRRLEGD